MFSLSRANRIERSLRTSKVFISYRRDDSSYVAQQIHEAAIKHFGRDAVVFDVDSIPLGVDFREFLDQQVRECDVLVAIIGNRWLEILNSRLKEQNDFVRLEIESALKRHVPIVPVLVGKASMPSEHCLPAEIAGLAYRNASEVRAGKDLKRHLDRLILGLERAIAEYQSDEKKRGTTNGRSEFTADRILEDLITGSETGEPQQDPGSVQKDEENPRILSTIVAAIVTIAMILVATAFVLKHWRAANPQSTVIFDGLVWTSRDNGQDIDWRSAQSHCRELAIAGWDSWRSPTIEELESIYDSTISYPAGEVGRWSVHVKDPILLSSNMVWSSNGEAATFGTYFNFVNGSRGSWRASDSQDYRALCVHEL